MQNQIIENLTLTANILGSVARIFWFVIPIAGAIWYLIYVLRIRRQVEIKQKEIFSVKEEIDGMLETVHQQRKGYINQSQLEAITERDRVPLRARLETLIMERQYLLDKISILNLIKK